ncbi:MAG: LmeA family phospholipid-binding protein [Solirubrobacteraceae bacterium]
MRRLIAVGVLALVVVILGVAQLVLPGIAAQRLRDQLGRSGQVLSVQVHAVPAIELLWHHADKVVIRLGRYRTPMAKLGSSLRQSGSVGSLLVTAGEVDAGLLKLHDATLVKRGARLTASATVTEADLRAALPILQSVTPVTSAAGQLTLQGTAGLFGVTARVDATVAAVNGQLVVSPDVPLGGFATLTVFANPHVEVQSVGASAVAGGFAVHGTATVR